MAKENISTSKYALINNIQNDTYRLLSKAGAWAAVIVLSFLLGYFYRGGHIIIDVSHGTGSNNTGLVSTGVITSTGSTGLTLPATGATGNFN